MLIPNKNPLKKNLHSMHKKGFYHSKIYILKLIISIQHFCFKYPVKNEFIKILIVRSDAIYIKF